MVAAPVDAQVLAMGVLELLRDLEPEQRLMEVDVGHTAAGEIRGGRIGQGVLDRVADRGAETAGVAGVLPEDLSSDRCVGRRRRPHLGPEELHVVTPVRLLLERALHHEDLGP